MYEILISYSRIIGFTLIIVLFLITLSKIILGAKDREHYYFLIIIIILGVRIFLNVFSFLSFFLLIFLIYIIGRYHYRLNQIQEVLIWRTCNITIFLFTLISGFISLYKQKLFFILEIVLILLYTGFQIIFLKKNLKVQYGTQFVLLWFTKVIYLIVSVFDIIIYIFNFQAINALVWAMIWIALYLGFLLIFNEELLFPSIQFKQESIYSTYEKLIATENRLILQDKLVKTGLLATGIIHELKNVFFAINTSIQFALKKQDAESINQSLEIIKESAEKGISFTETILRKVKIEDNQTVEIPLAAECERILKMLKVNYRSEGVEFLCQIDSTLSLHIGKIDFEQIMLNLLSNAVHALKNNHVKEKRIEIKAYSQEDRIIIDVIDNGPGVPEELEFDIFNPAVSNNASTGLGLYITDLLVKRNHGYLFYYPSDQGAHFQLIFESEEEEY